MRAETDPGRWETAYNFPALRKGRVVKEEFPYGLPKGMVGLVFNTRRPMFADVRVREALLQLFDFEWINHNFFFNLYKRTASYFDGCDLSAHGVPANARERELLKAFPGAVRADIMAGTWAPPKTDGSGRDRAGLRRAFALFKQAGYALQGTRARPSRQRPAVRASKCSPIPATRSAWRSPMRAASSAPASPCRCATSTRPSSSTACSASIST